MILGLALTHLTSLVAQAAPDLAEIRPLPKPSDAPVPVVSPVPQPRFAPEGDAMAPPPKPRRRLPPACTSDGAYCIGPFGFVRDVCAAIEKVAQESALDPHFLARLIWKESLFDPYAVSNAGALGIAQFMPGTARLRGLDDPLNPAEALRASARYLSDLRRKFGNLGLAAGAYNGGENRMERYVTQGGLMPLETRAYVRAITGHSLDAWRSAPPQGAAFTLKKGESFRAACTSLAGKRIMREYRIPDELMPWVVVIAVNASEEAVRHRVEGLMPRFPNEIDRSQIRFGRTRLPGKRQRLATALIGSRTEDEARQMCLTLRRATVGCMALRNRGYYEPIECTDCEFREAVSGRLPEADLPEPP